ncbi:MAG: hypothetical protein HQ470_05950, partial [Methylophilales bacterium]|nr:hypothetical protein [Methylophilales bacterium]
KRDELRGLKENVIVGRLIPAGTGMAFHLNRKEAARLKALPQESVKGMSNLEQAEAAFSINASDAVEEIVIPQEVSGDNSEIKMPTE